MTIRQSDLKGYSLDDLNSAATMIVVDLVGRVEEAEESKAEAHRAYDELCEVSEAWRVQAKLLREGCEKASKTIVEASIKMSDFEARIYNILVEALAKAEALDR
jgi:hypothetical protein